MKTKEKLGISLIVLIITIVVIIILAAAVILTISKNNPVESAKKATFVSDISAYQDELSMYIGNEYIKKEGNYDVAILDSQPLESVVEINSKYNEKFMIYSGRIAGTDKLTEQEKEWAESIIGSATIPVPSNYTDTDGKKAYIPKDFTVSEVESEKKIDTGLVVKDIKGNEFIWIPVEYTSEADFNTKFVRKQGYNNGSLQTNQPFENFVEPDDSASQSEIDEHKAMVDSVKKYHGYYIARYEASNDGSGNVQSKPNATSWVNIIWGKSTIDSTGGAVEKARAMHPLTTATVGSAVSTLPYGVQWDIAIDYIEKYGEKNTTFRRDSTGKGNYSKYIANTGSNASYALNNIYDMAGNVWEWTMEANAGSRVLRGGHYYDGGIDYPVSYRNVTGGNTTYSIAGFRIALYIM